MAKYPADYAFRPNKVTISGDCFGGIEIWSTGFYVGSTSADAADPGTTTAAAIAAHWTTFFTSAGSRISQAYRTLQVKVSQLETDGDVDMDMIDIYDYPAAIVGINGGNPMPPQISLAATLTSDLQRGLASKGRMYLPGVNPIISNSDPRISTGDRDAIATALKTFMDSLNADAAVPGEVILASKGRKFVILQDPENWSYVNGVNAKVTGLRVGNVYDTQRRRRNDVTELYATRVLA